MSIRFDEKGKFFSTVVEKVPVPVVIQTHRDRFEGNFHVRPDERLKDAINQEDAYIALTEVYEVNLLGEKKNETDLMFFNSNHIIWILPVKED